MNDNFFDDVTYTYNRNGSLTLTKLTPDHYYFHQTYYNYTKRQAKKLFREAFEEEVQLIFLEVK